jgi:uncharacterized membrane protein YhhN
LQQAAVVWLILYSVLFWVFALVFTVVKSIRSGEIYPKRRRIKNMPVAAAIAIKIAPAALAALFVFFMRPSSALFYLLMTLGLFLCLLGDTAMEISLLPGLGLFALAHIDFTATFTLQLLTLGTSQLALLATAALFFVMIVYAYLLQRYLQPSPKGLGKMRGPVLVYATLISLTLSTAALIWITSGVVAGGFVVLGAVLFVISDSLIGIRNFHHHFANAALAVHSTYYLAIFLLSMTGLIYFF